MGKYSFGTKSEMSLSTCDFALQNIARQALALGLIDFMIIEGYRTDEKQHEYFIEKKSKVDAGNPKAMHNKKPLSKAMDCVPYINGNLSWNKLHCCCLGFMILSVAANLGYTIRWGGNWDMDGEPITDQDFQDLVHFELI
uniref:Putative structural protein n=1 Tax=viral metagenome TaxID=1070528 RepID=A0A6M3JZY2_9ZZZZ